MRATAVLVLSGALLLACAESHTRSVDGTPGHSGESSDASTHPESVPCDPNQCYDGEICCHAECGLCTDPAACIPTLPCVESELVCGGEVCSDLSPFGGFCCPGCDSPVCPADDVYSRAECPPVSCD